METLRHCFVAMVTLLVVFVLPPEGAGDKSSYTGKKDADNQQCGG